MKEKINPEDIKLKGFSGLTIRDARTLTNSKGERMTNSEWLSHICEYGHPVAQCMIMQALYSFADSVISQEDELIEEEEKLKEEGKMQFLSNTLWVEIAKWLRLKYHYQYEAQLETLPDDMFEDEEEQSDAS